MMMLMMIRRRRRRNDEEDGDNDNVHSPLPLSPKDHTSLQERLEAASILKEFGVEGELAVDSMENLSTYLYGAVPERLAMVEGGVVTYLGGMGPKFYKLREVEERLQALGTANGDKKGN